MLVPDVFKSASSVAVSVVALPSVIGNILVITTFFKTQNPRISTNYYITSMAVSDLLFFITNWPLYLCSRLSIFGHSVSSFQCKLGNYSTSVSYSVSVESLVLVTVDCFPPYESNHDIKKDSNGIYLANLDYTRRYSRSILVFARQAEPDEIYLCTTDSSGLVLAIYRILGFVLIYYVPCIILIVLNVHEILERNKSCDPRK